MSEADLALIGIDAATIASVYMRSFGWVITAWAGGFIVGLVVQMIKKM